MDQRRPYFAAKDELRPALGPYEGRLNGFSASGGYLNMYFISCLVCVSF